MPDRILVVDDEKEIADLIEVYLSNENYRIFKYYTGQEALACIEREELDLAILDIMLPDINFERVNEGVHALLEDDAEIRLPSELYATEQKLNAVKRALKQRTLEAQLAEQRKMNWSCIWRMISARL